MFQIFLGLLILIFGVFLKVTKDSGFSRTKKFWWMFVAIGVLAIIGQLFIKYQLGEL